MVTLLRVSLLHITHDLHVRYTYCFCVCLCACVFVCLFVCFFSLLSDSDPRWSLEPQILAVPQDRILRQVPEKTEFALWACDDHGGEPARV